MTNQLKTVALLAALTALLLLVGYWLGGGVGLLIALVLGAGLNFGAWWWSDKIVLRMHGAREVGPMEAPELHAMVHGLAMRAGLPTPRVFITPEESPNAFATGRDPEHGVVAVTEGLLRLLPREEIEGVVAHELAHIKNRDTLVMTVAAALAGSLSVLAELTFWNSMFGGSHEEEGGGAGNGLMALFVAPIAAMLVQMSISRTREYQADEAAGRLTGKPLALGSALRRIEAWSQRLPEPAGTPATAHLYIQNPFSAQGLGRLFSTHPPVEERVKRLENLAYRGYPLAA